MGGMGAKNRFLGGVGRGEMGLERGLVRVQSDIVLFPRAWTQESPPRGQPWGASSLHGTRFLSGRIQSTTRVTQSSQVQVASK